MFDAPLSYDPEQIKDLLRTKLDSGEKILWYGQPDPELAAKRSSSWFWFGCAIVSGVGAYLVVPTGFVLPAGLLSWKVGLGLLSALFVHWGFKAPDLDRKMAKMTLYAVTTKQVVKLQATNPKSAGTVVKWFLTRTLNKDLLEQPLKKPINSSGSRADLLYAIHKGEETTTEYAMQGIADAEGAIAALRQLGRLHEEE